MKIGDRVTSVFDGCLGTIIEISPLGRAIVQWDDADIPYEERIKQTLERLRYKPLRKDQLANPELYKGESND